ncbi:MAG: hypothetical protein ACE5EX_08340 [Phycisphaerae bacterium]
MSVRNGLLFIGTFVAATVVGCDGSLTGGTGSVLTRGLKLPPGTNAIVALATTAKVPGTTLQTATNGLSLDSAMLVVEDIKLYLPADGVDDGEAEDEDGFEMTLQGPFLVDLKGESVRNLGTGALDADADDDGVDDVDDSDDDNDGVPDEVDSDDDGDGVPDADDQTVGETTKIFDAVTIPEGIYRRIKFRLDDLTAEDAPASDHPLIGKSVVVNGTISGMVDGAATDVPMEFCANFDDDLEFRSTMGVTVVKGGSIATFLMTVDPDGWFVDVAGTDFTGRLTGGKLIICEDSNADLGELVRTRIRERFRMGRDDDGDGSDDDDADGDLEDDDPDGGVEDDDAGVGQEDGN